MDLTRNKLKQKIKKYGELVMFSHTLFSLPFALMAMFVAADGLPPWNTIIWILVALVAGRNGANAFNRYADAEIDKKNPRTSTRHIPKGEVKKKEALILTIVCYVIFVVAAGMINTICLLLSPVALFLFTLYSYTKRFTWICHIVLGVTCAGAPVGAWLAVRGKFELVPIVYAAIVTLWVAGFDIIYGTQDIEFDRAEHLFSIPARFGLSLSLWIARGLHACMVAFMISLYFLTNLSMIYLSGVVIATILLKVEHYLVEPKNAKKMNFASYHINQIISVLLLFVTVVDVFFF